MARLDAPGTAFPVDGNHTAADRETFAMAWQAQCRVERSPRLRKYKAIIFADWPEGDDHLRWVIRGKVGEIEAWARRIADDR